MATTARRLAAHPLVRRLRALGSGDRTADPVLLALAAAVGLVTGLLAVALIEVIRLVQAVAFGTGLPDVVAVLLAPALGGLAVGLIVHRAVPEAAGSGVGQVMTSIALHGGRMRPVAAIAKVATAGVGLGTGASGGRESPIVHIGGIVGSTAGRLVTLGDDQRRALIAAGAGAGIAASFNAPIAGMLFALEVIIGGFRARSLQVVVVACVVASVTAQEIVGEALIYDPPPHRLTALGLGLAGVAAEFALYAALGLAAVAVGVAFIRGEVAVARVTARLRIWPPLRVALGGLLMGLIAVAVPEVLGTGDHLPPVLGVVQEPIAAMLDGDLGGTGVRAAGFLLVLLVAKLVATALTIGTGSTVGSFAPAIFMGAALGGAFGHVAAVLLPDAGVQPGAFALVGTAAVVGATYRAPLTAILIAFELTGDYGLVLPLMFATGIATFVADRIEPGTIATLPLLRRGIVYAEPEDVDVMQTVRVGEVMTLDPDTVPADLPLPALRTEFARTGHHGFPVLDTGANARRLVGIVTRSDLPADDPAVPTGALLTAGDLCTRRLVTVTPDDPVYRALRRMAAVDVGRLPVVAATDHGVLVGLVRRADVVRAYQRAVTRSLGVQQRRAASRLRDLGGARFVELLVDAAGPAAGQAVRDVEWPARTVLTSIRRGGDLVVPDGNTVLEPGDEVVVLTGDMDAVRDLLGGDADAAGAATGGG